MKQLDSNEMRTIVKYLSTQPKYKTSIAPRRVMADDLKEELISAGIPTDDHLLFIMNNFSE